MYRTTTNILTIIEKQLTLQPTPTNTRPQGGYASFKISLLSVRISLFSNFTSVWRCLSDCQCLNSQRCCTDVEYWSISIPHCLSIFSYLWLRGLPVNSSHGRLVTGQLVTRSTRHTVDPSQRGGQLVTSKQANIKAVLPQQ